ncbi:NADP-dependent glyceraldehyde-3-phosphate dehydrogenase, partial [mine drainage metagenome]
SDLDVAAEKVCGAAFESQGQNYIHTQRIILSSEVEEYFTNRMIDITSGLRMGDPHDISTDIGPMISESKAEDTENVILEAVEDGGELVSGGQREGKFIRPTIVRNVSMKSRLWTNEVFAPVCCISVAKSLNEAIGLANDTSYGLQAGIFTSDLNVARIASEKLDFGTVLINETSD